MPTAMVLSGPDAAGGDTYGEGCRCVRNKRTRRGVLLCPAPKSKKHRSGFKFSGPCQP